MMFSSFRRFFAGKSHTTKSARRKAMSRREKPKGRQCTFERLEDRTVPSTLTTNKLAYAPTDVATFTGSGFQAGEIVYISVVGTNGTNYAWTLADDASGNF